MPSEHRPGPNLHVWNGMLNPRSVQVRGEDCQFVTLESKVESRWYQQTTTLKALAEWCIQCAPTVVPTIPRDPYPCMPTVPTDDKANVCGFCGSRDECTIRLLLQSRSTRRRMVVAVSTCPSQPCAITWSRMSTATKANPCTNRPVNCPQCTTTVLLYSVAAPPTTSHTPPMPPSESEATAQGDCRTRPLKSTRKRAKERKWRHALLEATQERARPTSDLSSGEEDYFDRPPDQRY